MSATVPRRWVLLCAIALAVAVVHLLVLLAWGPAWFEPDGAPAPPHRALQVRSVVQAPPPVALPPAMPAAAKPETRAAPAPVRIAPASVPVLAPVQETPIVAEAPAPSSEAVIEVPVYATRLPPPGLWRYRLQRGLAIGEAELSWAPEGDANYTLRLEGRIAGINMLEWVSQGQIDAAGLAPERFVLRRRGRDRQAANFQREAGKISFSGPTHEQPLLPGAQDRLSWLLQLPAIVAAAPERFVSGTSVVLFVAGARGDADVWTFVVQGPDSIDGTPALKLIREPRLRYDTRVEIWLDPAEHHLPLRAVQTPSGGGAALELQRERAPR